MAKPDVKCFKKISRALFRETREGFRLLIAWLVGFLSFGFLSALSERVISYFQPWKSEGIAQSEAGLLLLLLLIGLGFLTVVGALIFEDLKRRRSPPAQIV